MRLVRAMISTGALLVTACGSEAMYGAASGYQRIASGKILLSVQPSPSVTSDSPRSLANLNGIAVSVASAYTLVAAG